jgi:hypothetical protein
MTAMLLRRYGTPRGAGRGIARARFIVGRAARRGFAGGERSRARAGRRGGFVLMVQSIGA